MSSSKHFVSNQLKRWKDAASQLMANDADAAWDGVTMIELEPEYFERCKQLAAEQKTTVSAVVHNLLKQQLSLASLSASRFRSEQTEHHPLLALDGLTRGRRAVQQTEQEVDEDELDD